MIRIWGLPRSPGHDNPSPGGGGRDAGSPKRGDMAPPTTAGATTRAHPAPTVGADGRQPPLPRPRALFCARDPFGIKPFYYCIDRGPGMVSGADSNGAARGAAAPGLAPRLRGGRHAAPAAASEPAAPEQADPPAAPDDWFSPAMRSARRPGRHAAGGP